MLVSPSQTHYVITALSQIYHRYLYLLNLINTAVINKENTVTSESNRDNSRTVLEAGGETRNDLEEK